MSSLFAQSGAVGTRGIKRLAISATAVLIILLVLVIAIRPIPASVQITFLGFTNNPPIPHVTYAAFCISNTGKCSMHGWGAYDFEREGWPQDHSIQLESPPPISELKPGESKIVFFLELPQTGPWRLAVPLAKIDWRYRIQRNWPRIYQRLPWHLRGQLGVRYEDFHSDWIIILEATAKTLERSH